MATFTFHLRPSKTAGSQEGKLFIRIIHKRQVKDIPMPYGIRYEEWNEGAGRIVYHDCNPSRNDFLAGVESRMHSDLTLLKMLEERLAAKGKYKTADIVAAYKDTWLDRHSLLAYCRKVGVSLIAGGQVRTARAYRSAVRCLLLFRGDAPLRLGDIDAALMRRWEAHLKKQGLQMNTVSFYIRQIRALYHRAVADKLIPPQAENPFAGVYTGVCDSRKRALNQSEVRALMGVQHRLDSMFADKSPGIRQRGKQAALRDSLRYFNFCLEARGMSWVDMVFLKKSDLEQRSLSYRRRKTGKALDVCITPNMRKIIRKFAGRTKGSPYVFPVIDPRRGNELKQYETGLRRQNELLGELASLAGIAKKVTTHVSRHTWATVARDNGIDIPVISEMLGHSDVKVTYRYLDSIDDRLVEKVTRKVTKAFGIAA